MTVVETFATAISLEYPIIGLLVPALGQISGAAVQGLLERTSTPSGFKADIQSCLKDTVEKMTIYVPTKTIQQAVEGIHPTLEDKLSKLHTTEFNFDELVATVQEAVEKEAKYGEEWLDYDDILKINQLFLKEFELCLYNYHGLQGCLAIQTLKKVVQDIEELRSEVNKILKSLRNFEEKIQKTSISEEALKQLLKKSFDEEKSSDPHFFADRISELLLPKISISNNSALSKNEELSFEEFLHNSWNRTEQEHISLTGIGGIGKTTSLLITKYTAPVIYIPLRNLANDIAEKTDFIQKYIRETTLKGDDAAYNTFAELCNKKWEIGPNVIILLDGINEVDADKRDSILDEIEKSWLRKSGLQLIITSRYDIRKNIGSSKINRQFSHLQIQPLTHTTIEKYLEVNGLHIDRTSHLLEVIRTPLMLMLYLKSELAIQDYDRKPRGWREAINSGSIIWNFLLSEHLKAKRSEKGKTILAVLLFAPYICYKMMRKNVFALSSEEFVASIDDAIDYYEKIQKRKRVPAYIRTELTTLGEKTNKIWENSVLYGLLVNKFGIFVEMENKIKISHQNLRDCLAAIHIVHTIDKAKTIPKEWKTPFDQYVLEYIADLLETEKFTSEETKIWQRVWKFGYQKNNQSKFVEQMLILYRKAYGIDISNVDFSEVDLRHISLASYKLSSQKRGHFRNAILGRETFWGQGHADTVSGISWSQDEKQYISASYDCTIRIHQDSGGMPVKIIHEREIHKHYIRCAEVAPNLKERIASAGDDRDLVVWTKTGDNWVGQKWGTCDNWIRRLSWDPQGSSVVCGDGEGNIILFTDDEYKEVFPHKHRVSITALTWMSCLEDICISGDEDGNVLFWDRKGNLKNSIHLDAPIVSIAWLQQEYVLLVATTHGLYFYAVQQESFEPTLKKEEPWDNRITYVAASTKENSTAYLAVFDSHGLIICSVQLNGEGIDWVPLASHEYRGEINSITTAKWNKACDKMVCGARDGSVIRIDINEKELEKERITFRIIGRRCCKAARCSAWSNDQKYLAVGYDDAMIRIWDATKGQCIHVLNGHSDSIKCVAWSPDGKRLAIGSDDARITVWTQGVATAETISVHQGPVNAILWINDQEIVSAGDDALLTVTNIATGDSIRREGHKRKIYTLALSEEQRRLVSCGNDKDIIIWDTTSWKPIMIERGVHEEPIRAVAWNGSTILTSSNDETLKLWRMDEDKLEHLRTFVGLEDFVYGANISDDGKVIIGGCTDSTVGFWKVEDEKPLYMSNAHKNFIWNVSVGGRYAATSSSDGTVKIWDLSEEKVNDNMEPIANLEVIPESNIVGCDFRGAIMEEDLKKMLWANGGIVDEDEPNTK